MLYILQYSSSEKKIFCVPFFKFLQHAKSLFCYYIHLKHTKRLLCNYIHLKQQQIIRPEFDRVRLSCTDLRNKSRWQLEKFMLFGLFVCEDLPPILFSFFFPSRYVE